MLLISLLSLSLVLGAIDASSEITSCSQVKNLPCIEVPMCSQPSIQVKINQQSSGKGNSYSSSDVGICYTSSALLFSVQNYKQTYFPADKYQSCNDNVFLLDVLEVFIAPGSNDPHCYSEIDSSPYKSIFESGIYNPYLNHTGVSNYLIDCATTGITHSTTIQSSQQEWSLSLSIPWEVINKPAGCPAQSLSATPTGKVYRANLYRVNALTQTTQCSSSTCEYMAWSPTDVYPPAFHEPTKFGYLLLK